MGLVVDNFAGGGGASTGIELALGRHVDIAINHDPQAIAMHKANHPLTRHFTDDVFNIDPKKVCKGQPVDLCWLSPDCTHFSRAKGGVPKSKKIRGLAWIAVKWAANVKPAVIILENVQEFKTWGPLTKEGYPDKRKTGQTFHKFIATLESFGYSVDYRELTACDYGAPTSRKRFFLIARSDKKPIIWPTPTYSKNGEDLPKWKSAASIIDWSIPTKSIFNREKPLCDATNRRIARGIKKFVLDNPNPFILSNNFNNTGSDINSPLPTITTQTNHSALITPFISQIGQTGFSSDRGRLITQPISTIVTKNEHLLVSPILAPYFIDYHFKNKPSSVESPMKTITTVRGQYLISPVLTPMGWIDPQGKRMADIQKPLGTVTAGGNKFAITSATLIQTGYGEAKGQAPRVPGLDKPIGTIVSTCKHGLVEAFFKEHPLLNKGFYTASIIKQYGGNYQGGGSDIKKPLDTVTSVDHNGLLVCAFLDKYYGSSKIGQDLNKPLGTVTSKDRFSLVTLKIKGKEYYLADIGMRMLVPRELYNAQGFPPDYIIDRDCNGNEITISQQIAKCGNSVPPAFSEALVRANLPELASDKKITTMKDLYRHRENINLLGGNL